MVSTEGVNWIGLTEDIYKFNFLSSRITVTCSCKTLYYTVIFFFCNYRLLNHIAEINQHSKSDELRRFLEAVYHTSVPDPGRTLQVPFNDGRDVCTLFLCGLSIGNVN